MTIKPNKNSVYLQAVLESTLLFKLNKVAQSLFHIWVALAREHYPHHVFEKPDQNLPNDLVQALAKGLELVWRKENEDKRRIPDWSVNFVMDAVPSWLNTHWSEEYIYKQTPQYREVCLLKALAKYLKMDALAIKKTAALYQHMMSKEMTVESPQTESDEKIVNLNQFKKNRAGDNPFKNQIVHYLESLYYEQHFLIFGDILKNRYTFGITDFFGADEIGQLIDSVKR